MTTTKKRTFIVSEQICISHAVEATSEAEAKSLYEAYIQTKEGREEMIESALSTTWDSEINVEECD